MYQKKIPVSLDCGLHLFMQVMNGKWKINLVWCIYSGFKRPSELQRKIPKATRRVLDVQLKQLTEHGLISKITFAGKPLRTEYELTPLGQSIIPAIKTTAQWGESNREALEKLIYEQS